VDLWVQRGDVLLRHLGLEHLLLHISVPALIHFLKDFEMMIRFRTNTRTRIPGEMGNRGFWICVGPRLFLSVFEF